MPFLSIVIILGALSMATSQWFIFYYAPIEEHMGLVQKIFYIHLPVAWWALISFFVLFIASIAYLRTRLAKWDALAKASAEIGVLLTTLTLITGSIWGKHSWGVWWTWDPRLSTALIMWFIYAAYLLIQGLPMPAMRNANVRAVIGIVAFIDVPLVFFSARLWRSIHPAVFASQGGGLDVDMKITLIICLISFGLIWAGLLVFRKKQLEQTHRLKTNLTYKRDELYS